MILFCCRRFRTREALAASALLLLVSCSGSSKLASQRMGEPGATQGLIYVGRPEVYTREHLVNERLDRDAWLRKQLEAADAQTFGMQGLAETRSFRALLSRTEAYYDPAAFGLHAAQQKQQLGSLARTEEIEELSHLIAVARLRRELENVGSTDAATPTATPAVSPSPSTTPEPPAQQVGSAAHPSAAPTPLATPSRPATENDQPYKALLGLAAAVAPSANSVSASPIDVFRDRLAYRDELYAQRAQNSLDDAHDLRGHTLYQLRFDATVIPEDDTSSWAMVEVAIEPPVEPSHLYNAWSSRLQEYLNHLAWYRASVLSGSSGTPGLPPRTLGDMLRFANGHAWRSSCERYYSGQTGKPGPSTKQLPSTESVGEAASLYGSLQRLIARLAAQYSQPIEDIWACFSRTYTADEFTQLLRGNTFATIKLDEFSSSIIVEVTESPLCQHG